MIISSFLQRLGYWLPMPMLCLILSCSQPKPSTETLFTTPENTGIQFTNTVKNDTDFNIFSYRNFYNGAGVAIGDINNDSLPDIYFAANMGSNKLYLNKGNWQFEDITEKAGTGSADKWSTGVVMVDINADGLLDIYVCNAGFQQGIAQDNQLYINNGDLTFTEKAKEYGLADAGYTTHAAFFDFDRDGDLDCYILNNSFIPVNTLNYSNKRNLRAEDWPVADFLKGGGDRFLRNDNGKFVDISEKAGIYGSLIGFGLGVTVGDVNGDLYPDIYVSNDFFERDYLYINQQNGSFKESLETWIGHTSLSSMGADMADINNDGYPDLFVTDMLPDNDMRHKTTSSYDNYHTQALKENMGFYHQYMQNTLQLNNRNGGFYEIAHYSGVSASDWSWGGLIFDADNDGFNDLFVCNGIYQDVTDQDFIDFFANDIIQNMVMTGQKEDVDEVISKMPSRPIANKAFRNKGNLRFDNVAAEWGLDAPTFSNGAAYGDLDNDGDLDLVVNNVNQPALVYRNGSNATAKAKFISVQLKGTGGNTFAIGSCVKIFQGNQVISREVIPTRGFQSSCDYTVVAGLQDKPADSMQIIWPNGRITSISKPAPGKKYFLSQPDSGRLFIPLPVNIQPLFSLAESGMAAHKEDDYVDFFAERNIPQMMSREGPAMAVADVNGDGLEDVFMGGATWQPGQLYLQTPTGFVASEQAPFKIHAEFEDVTAVFFDANGDKWADLMVGSGGNHVAAFSPELQNRLYLNDGKGNFSTSSGKLPPNAGNTSVIAPFDWDKDGDTDLFIGSRCAPQSYGTAPNHYFLQNDGTGKFTDITAAVFKEKDEIRMITSAVWADLDQSGKPQLVISGEWMQPEIWNFTGKKFEKVSPSLPALQGWWLSLHAADLDADGKTDLVLGNQGENYYLRPSDTADVKLWVGDFDGNGIADKLMTRQIAGRDIPVFLKRELTDQLPGLKKQNLRHAEYASKTIQDLVGKEAANKTNPLVAVTGGSMVLWNNGNFLFEAQKLPAPVQFSSIRAITSADLNKDGKPDLVLAGNDYHFLPQFSRLDASNGHVLINAGNRNWTWLEPRLSGMQVKGQVRNIRALSGNRFLFGLNADKPVMLQLNPVK
jgi:hypothetical protein